MIPRPHRMAVGTVRDRRSQTAETTSRSTIPAEIPAAVPIISQAESQ